MSILAGVISILWLCGWLFWLLMGHDHMGWRGWRLGVFPVIWPAIVVHALWINRRER